jgi:acyl-CoA thioester hydrolase
MTMSETGFRTSFDVRVGDINYGGHMGNERFLLLFHDTWHRFLKGFGASAQDVGEGVGLIMVESNVRYQAEVFLDDVLQVTLRTGSVRAVRFDFVYEVTRLSDGVVVANGRTKMAGFDYAHKSPAALPEDFIERMESIAEAADTKAQ